VTVSGGSFPKTMLDSSLTDDQIVEAMYLRSLSRKPTDQERQIAQSWIAENRETGIEDLQWSLLNKLDFLFNY
jgi:hypothetical protein